MQPIQYCPVQFLGPRLLRMSIARVLVVDAFKPWREVLCRLLENELDLLVLHSSSDGMDAVRQAARYQPDLVILDVDLPGLNGIEVARQISQLSPKPKLMFLSMNVDPDIVQAAFEAGADAFVLKTDAAKDLLVAVPQMAAGQRFVSAAISVARGLRPPRGTHPKRED